jgi:hypothetical protein
MNAHTRRGFTYSDVVDYGLTTYRKCARRRPIFTHLSSANDHLVHAMHYARKGEAVMPGFYTYEDHVRFAREHLRKAREWRKEIAAL